MGQEEFQVTRSKEFSKKSNTELIDLIATESSAVIQETAKAILDERAKKQIEELTRVIKDSTTTTINHNEVMVKYTKSILFLTIILIITAIISIYYAWVQSQPIFAERARNEARTLELCKSAPWTEFENISGGTTKCEEYLKNVE